MAFSSSVKRAQAIKICELCQEDSIKWRCLDCDMCLCEKCKTFHLRVPATAKHHIVTIGTPLQDVKRKVILDNIPCKDHPEKMACLFCKSCDFLICTECVSSIHKKHNFIPIESALDEKLDYLRGIHDKIDANLKCCESKTSEIQDIKSQYKATFDESLANIKQKERELINAIKKYSKDLQEKVENERSQLNAISSKIEKEIENTKKNFKGLKKEIDAILTSNQGSVIFKADVEIKDPKFDSLPNKVEQFIPETETSKKIPEIFGSLHKISYPINETLPDIKFEVIRTFTTDLPLIDVVVTLDEKSAWFNCFKNKVIRKVNIQDNNMVISQEVSLDILNMTLTSRNELLLSIKGISDVKLLKGSGELVSFLTVAPLIPLAIYVSKNNDIILGVKEPGNPYKKLEQSQRAVVVYSMDGKQKQRYQYDKDGKKLFTYPQRITTNYNKNVVVIDITSPNTQRIVVLNKEGNFRWLYEGHHKINATEQFNPRDIVTTAIGHIIISDIGTNALHVLSERELLTCQVMRNIGVVFPWGLDIDNKGRLWVGCGTGGGDKGAKLHIIKYMCN